MEYLSTFLCAKMAFSDKFLVHFLPVSRDKTGKSYEKK